MGLINQLTGLFSRKSYADVSNPAHNELLRAMYQFKINSGIASVMSDNPDAYLSEGYQGNADVYAIINKIVSMGSQARLALWQKDKTGRWVEVTTSDLNHFVRAVNPTMKTADFISGSLVYKMVIGNAFWYKPTLKSGLNAGKTDEVWLMPSNNVRIVESGNWFNPIAGYKLETSNKIQDFATEDVYHIKFFNPLFGNVGTDGYLYGQSPLKAAAETVSKLNQAEVTELKQFENQSPPYLLYRDVQDMFGLTEEQQITLQNKVKEYAANNKGRLMVLPDKFGLLSLGVNAVDLNILQSSQEGRRILCNIYGIPSELLNDKAASTYNNMIEAKKSAWTDCIMPALNDIANSLTAFLIDPVPEYSKQGLFFAFDYNDIPELQKDRALMVTWMRQAYWTPNEIRDATGVNPYPNEMMDEPFVQLGETPISQLGAMSDIPEEELLKHTEYINTKK